MTINAKKTDWVILDDNVSQGQAAGARPGGAGSLLFDIDLSSDTFYVAEPASANLISETDSFTEYWINPVFAAGASMQSVIFIRHDGVNGYLLTLFWDEPLVDFFSITMERSESGDKIPLASIEFPPVASFLFFVGIRVGVADTPEGPRLEISYNLNGAGWLLLTDIVDVGDTIIAGNAGKWTVLFQNVAVAGSRIQMDDLLLDNNPVPVAAPTVTYPLTEDFEDVSWT